MAYQETEAAVSITNPEVVTSLQVRVRPTEQKIDAPPNSQIPVRPFTTREGNSFVLENAVRVYVQHFNGDGSVDLGLEPVCLQTMAVLGFLPIRVEDEIIHFGKQRRVKIWKTEPDLKKVVFAVVQPRQIFDEYKAGQVTINVNDLDGQEGAF